MKFFFGWQSFSLSLLGSHTWITAMNNQTPRQWFVDALQRELGVTENDSDRMWELLSAFVQQQLKSEYPDSSFAAVVFDGADGEVIGLEIYE